MLNMFVVRKWAGFLLCGLFTTIFFFVGTTQFGLLWGVVFMVVGLFIFSLLGFLFIKNPFSSMLEGSGLLALDINSTGVIQPFIVNLKNPDIIGRLKNKNIRDVFDRNSVGTMKAPLNNKNCVIESLSIDDKGVLKFSIDADNYNKSRFVMLQYPCLLFNSHLNSFVTKDFLSDMEKSTFAEHTVLYLNRNMQELTSLIRDFGRYVVDSLNQKSSLFKNKWVWIIIIVFIVILLIMFAPKIMNVVMGSGSTAVEAVQGAGGTIVRAP